jgi:hypothetical protein
MEETHAMAASLATIETFKRENVVLHNHSIGNLLIKLTTESIRKSGLEDYIQVVNCPWMPVFLFKDKQGSINNGFRTLMLQEMIRSGILFQGVLIPCLSHSIQDIHYFSHAFEDSLKVYNQALEGGFEKFLIGPPTQPVFRRYN